MAYNSGQYDLNFLWRELDAFPETYAIVTGSQQAGELLRETMCLMLENPDEENPAWECYTGQNGEDSWCKYTEVSSDWGQQSEEHQQLLKRDLVRLNPPKYGGDLKELWVVENGICKEVEAAKARQEIESHRFKKLNSVGGVYLINVGDYYKIGQASDFNTRVSQIRREIADAKHNYHRFANELANLTVVHTFCTHWRSEVELFWHEKFAAKNDGFHALSEWFLLDPEDIENFKKKSNQDLINILWRQYSL